MYEKLKTDHLNISLIGGIVSSDNFFANMFKQKTVKEFSYTEIKKPEYPPEIGAAIMAMDYFSNRP
jgi:N-acetylglucosamine kinase-like BadF-type ATPase